MIALIEKCCKILDKGGFRSILITGLSKGFGCIGHELLIAELYAYGFDIEPLKFTDSYLTRKKQKLKIHSSFSKWSEVHIETSSL